MSEQFDPNKKDFSLDELISDAKNEIRRVDAMLGNEKTAQTEQPKKTQESDSSAFQPELPSDYADLQYEEESAPVKQETKRKRMPAFLRMLIYVVCVLAISLGLAVFGWKCAEDVLALSKPDRIVNVTVEENATISDITNMLHDNGLIDYPWLFRFYCWFSHSEQKIDPGTYQLNNLYDYHALVNGMIESLGKRTVVTLTIPEGYELKEIFNLLSENGVSNIDKLEDASANYHFEYDFLENLPYGDKNRLEGYLFPDTYDFYLGEEPEKVLDKFLHNFDKKLTDELRGAVDTLNESLARSMKENNFTDEEIKNSKLTLHDVVIVASLIEKESANPSESPMVASVIYNRLCSKTYPCLQIDATIQYALSERKEKLSEEDKAIISPYNTYTNAGLPVGPIANPGISSIRAALYPAQSGYYFYVLGTEGVHEFSETYYEHQDAIAAANG